MTIEDLKFLQTQKGQGLLHQYNDLSFMDLERLALSLIKKNMDHAPAIITTLELRKKAVLNFTKANEMFFTTEGLEQSSGERLARYVATRFKNTLDKNTKVVDLTSGIGGNAIFLARYFHTTAVDHNEIHLFCAEYNANVYGVKKNMKFVLDKSENNIADYQAFFLDPQRTRKGTTKTRSITNSSPRIDVLLPKIMEISENICLKISPAFDYEEIKKLPDAPEIEIISYKNTNIAAFLWFGKFAIVKRRATCFFEDEIISLTNQEKIETIPIVLKPLQYIYEPNNAIIKAHLIDEIANKNFLQKLHPKIALLTSNKLVNNKNKKLFRSFKVLGSEKFSAKSLKNYLNIKGITRANIIARGLPMTAEDIRKKLKLKEGGDHTIIATSLSDEKKYYFFTENV